MGVNDLHKTFIDRPNHEKKNKRNLADLLGTIGIDVSTIMYRLVSSPLGSGPIDVNPPVPLYHAYKEATTTLSLLTDKHKKQILLVFDNRSHPMKAGTQSGRRSDRETAQLKLADIYKTSDITDKTAEDVQKHRKAMAHPREDFIAMIIAFCKEKGIKFCSAPFEADWQLVSLQKQGIIQHILSSDGDLLVLGGDSIITDLNNGSGACCIYDTNSILQRKSMGGGMFLPQHLPLLACFSGNDYIARLHGNGPKKVLNLMNQFTALESLEEQQSFISDLQNESKWKTGDSKPANGFWFL
eukprot:scaffold78688_cov59-Cyclotella_meneghiniana.AAC.6